MRKTAGNICKGIGQQKNRRQLGLFHPHGLMNGRRNLMLNFVDHLAIIAFPCNQFGGQEPGTWQEISSSAQARFGVTFPILSKVEVNGLRSHPLFAWLKAASGVPGDIQWNFTKFLVVGGENITRYSHQVNPSQIEQAIDSAAAAAAGDAGDL